MTTLPERLQDVLAAMREASPQCAAFADRAAAALQAAPEGGDAVEPVMWKVTRPDGSWYTTDGPMYADICAALIAHGGSIAPLYLASPTHPAAALQAGEA